MIDLAKADGFWGVLDYSGDAKDIFLESGGSHFIGEDFLEAVGDQFDGEAGFGEGGHGDSGELSAITGADDGELKNVVVGEP